MKPEPRSTVFVVDDSPIVRERLIALLGELPNVRIIGQAGVAFAAVDAILRLRPDVVVLDISMPGGNGLYVLERIRQHPPTPLVIMLTNFSQEPYRQRCLQLGARHFFDKSTEFDKVLEVLRSFLPPPRPNRRTTWVLSLW